MDRDTEYFDVYMKALDEQHSGEIEREIPNVDREVRELVSDKREADASVNETREELIDAWAELTEAAGDISEWREVLHEMQSHEAALAHAVDKWDQYVFDLDAYWTEVAQEVALRFPIDRMVAPPVQGYELKYTVTREGLPQDEEHIVWQGDAFYRAEETKIEELVQNKDWEDT
jgi:predicted nuclease with TOPRIM domain